MIPTLYIFAGLPGSGKSTLAQVLAARLAAAYIRVDTIEQTLRELYGRAVEDEGYRLAQRMAEDILRTTVSVVADSCNPVDQSRRAWEAVAIGSSARYVNIEVVCSDPGEHRRRVEQRASTVPGLRLPTWTDVEQRDYHPWASDRLVVDTARRSVAECLDTLLADLATGGHLPFEPR